ncbi:MAG: hypothetical protein ACK4GC_01920 [Paracoccaceae bacterium]
MMHPNRQLRYLHGKSDSLEAESAARSVLNGQASSLAKTQAMITLKTLIINAPVDLRDTPDKIKGCTA